MKLHVLNGQHSAHVLADSNKCLGFSISPSDIEHRVDAGSVGRLPGYNVSTKQKHKQHAEMMLNKELPFPALKSLQNKARMHSTEGLRDETGPLHPLVQRRRVTQHFSDR